MNEEQLKQFNEVKSWVKDCKDIETLRAALLQVLDNFEAQDVRIAEDLKETFIY